MRISKDVQVETLEELKKIRKILEKLLKMAGEI